MNNIAPIAREPIPEDLFIAHPWSFRIIFCALVLGYCANFVFDNEVNESMCMYFVCTGLQYLPLVLLNQTRSNTLGLSVTMQVLYMWGQICNAMYLGVQSIYCKNSVTELGVIVSLFEVICIRISAMWMV